MEWFTDLLTNPYLIISLSSWFAAQVLKVIINAFVHRKLNLERMVGDGGMPSGHSATVASLATICGILHGTSSFPFAATFVLAIIVCHDAMGVRQETGKQAVILNEIISSFTILTGEDLPEVKLKELVGHTHIQVIAGILIGVVNAFVIHGVFF